jgi:hypothetical protein
MRILRQEAKVCAYSARGKFPEWYAQIRKVIARQLQKINFHLIAEIP